MKTAPAKPPSRTSRFAPLPSIRQGTRSRRQIARASASCASSRGVMSQRAGPPNPYQVYGASGASARQFAPKAENQLIGHFPNVSRAHRKHNIAGLHVFREVRDDLIEIREVFGRAAAGA